MASQPKELRRFFDEGDGSKIILKEEYQVKLKCMTAHGCLKDVCKSIYRTWLRFLDKGDSSRRGYLVEAFLAYWLFWYLLPSGLEEGWNL